MNNIILTTDSGMCCIKKDKTKIIPAQIVCSDGSTYKDNGEINNSKILDDMNNGLIYKTASPILSDFEDTFREILENKKDIIHLSMSSGISEGSVNSANLIANNLNEEYENKIYVIDSLTGATGGTLFYELAYNELLNTNLPTEQLVKKLNELKEKLLTAFYVPNADGYIRSGRDKTNSNLKNKVLSSTSQIMKLASLKFRVDFNDNGNLHFKNIFRSNQQNGMLKMVKDIVNENTIEKFNPLCVALGNLHKEKVNLENIKEYLNSFKYFNNIIEQDIGSVIAAYGCNDLCGISLVKK